MWLVARCGEVDCFARWVLRGGCNVLRGGRKCLTLWSVMYAFSVTGASPLEMHSSRFLFYICLFAQLFLNVEQMPLSGRNLEQMVLATEILNVPFFKK